MRWSIFCVFAFVALVIQTGLGPLLHWPGGDPNLLWVLAAFIAMWAQPMTALWAALTLGLLLDLHPLAVGSAVELSAVAILGPNAVGFVAGAYAVTVVRGVFYRDSSTAFAVMVAVAGAMMQIVVVSLYSLRGMSWFAGEPLAAWSLPDQFVMRFFTLLYSAAIALPLGWLLMRYAGIWGFETGKGGQGARRR